MVPPRAPSFAVVHGSSLVWASRPAEPASGREASCTAAARGSVVARAPSGAGRSGPSFRGSGWNAERGVAPRL